MDEDTQRTVDILNEALAESGMSQERFARALGTSPSRFSTYRSGKVAPTAAFVFRAQRIGSAMARARRARRATSLDAARAIRRARERSDDWAHAMTLEARDQIRDILRHKKQLAASWEAAATTGDPRQDTLLAALVAHEFEQAGMEPPRWTQGMRLAAPWILDSPRLTDDEVKEQTPDWLADSNVYAARKDLETT